MDRNTNAVSPRQHEMNIPTTSAKLPSSWLQAMRMGWFILMIAAVGILLAALPGYIERISSGLPGHGPVGDPSPGYVYLQAVNTLSSLAASILSLFLARVLFRYKFDNPAVGAVSFYLILYGTVMTGPLEAWGKYWLGSSDFAITAQSLLMATPTAALLFLFPNGRFVPGWTRWVLIGSIPWNIIAILTPFGPGQDYSDPGFIFLAFSWIALLVAGIYSQIIRYRQVSTPDERQQTKWVLFGFSIWIGYMLLSTFPYFYIINLPADARQPWWSPLSEFSWWLSLCIVPVTLTLAITRSRLWKIDIVINRTLVYGALTFSTMLLYIFVVGALGNLLNLGNNTFIAFLTTGLVAVLFQPLRTRLQDWVNRLMYGERDDPVSVLARLGMELEHTGSPEDALEGIVATVARALKLPYVAIELGRGNDLAASYGIPKKEVLRFPLVYQAETSGHLVVAPRSPGEVFRQADNRLLENIAHQAGAAAHAAKLTTDLRISRQKLVNAREEERRRMRRDLHDGLGPTLASMTLRIDAARNLMRENPAKAELLLEDLKRQTQATIEDIRTLVYELRPPALDQVGLVTAIQNHIEKQALLVPQVILEAPENLPQLPAALEVAAYRIVLEGLNNIYRHAEATQARVRLALQNNQLRIEIDDNGVGMPAGKQAGVGLTSMRERADELGGTFEVLQQKPGFHIRTRLPL